MNTQKFDVVSVELGQHSGTIVHPDGDAEGIPPLDKMGEVRVLLYCLSGLDVAGLLVYDEFASGSDVWDDAHIFVSGLIVDEHFEDQGVADLLYDSLFARLSASDTNLPIVTNRFSGLEGQQLIERQRLLEQLGFSLERADQHGRGGNNNGDDEPIWVKHPYDNLESDDVVAAVRRVIGPDALPPDAKFHTARISGFSRFWQVRLVEGSDEDPANDTIYVVDADSGVVSVMSI